MKNDYNSGIYFLLDDDHCLNPSACVENATCESIPGNVRCTCNTGFTGNQTYCEGTLLMGLCLDIFNLRVFNYNSEHKDCNPFQSPVNIKGPLSPTAYLFCAYYFKFEI